MSQRLIPTVERSGLQTHHDDEKHFVVPANEKLTAFLEIESVIHRPPPISDRRKLDYFLFEIGLSFAFRDE